MADISLPKMTYREFVGFMNRYNNDKKNKTYKNPYKYKRVFNKDKQNES